MGLTLLAQASIPLRFWWEAFQTFFYLINQLPTPILKFLSPLEKLYKRKPNYSFLKTFECSCFPYLRSFQSIKFQFHTIKCVFLGHNNSHKGYLCLYPSGKVYISWHVAFNENEFPYFGGFPRTEKLSPSAQPSLNFLIFK